MNGRNKTANNWAESPRKATLPASLGVSDIDKTDALFNNKANITFRNTQIEYNQKQSQTAFTQNHSPAPKNSHFSKD